MMALSDWDMTMNKAELRQGLEDSNRDAEEWRDKYQEAAALVKSRDVTLQEYAADGYRKDAALLEWKSKTSNALQRAEDAEANLGDAMQTIATLAHLLDRLTKEAEWEADHHKLADEERRKLREQAAVWKKSAEQSSKLDSGEAAAYEQRIDRLEQALISPAAIILDGL